MKPVWALGLMSGTSTDGIDAALLLTDGTGITRFGPHFMRVFSDVERERIARAVAKAHKMANPLRTDAVFRDVEEMITHTHAETVKTLLEMTDIRPEIIGFHGQTLVHRPTQSLTLQLGDPHLLSQMTRCDVVWDFRSNDMRAGGQGAPLAPVYHQALVDHAGLPRPVALVNLGGVGNITLIGEGKNLLAFDTGPANALLDDWMRQKSSLRFDEGGQVSAKGRIHEDRVRDFLNDAYFTVPPPKSLDRDHFRRLGGKATEGLSLEDGAATLVAITAQTLVASLRHLPVTPRQWVIAGGGAHNPTLMREISARLKYLCVRASELGWNEDFIEAQTFAYLAVRHLRDLPLSFPGTTGVNRPITGGVKTGFASCAN